MRAYIGKNGQGKPVYKSFTAPTKREAEYLAAEFAAKKKRPAERMTVGEAITRYTDSKDAVFRTFVRTIQAVFRMDMTRNMTRDSPHQCGGAVCCVYQMCTKYGFAVCASIQNITHTLKYT